MKKLPLGIQDFREIIDDGYVYVDKTQHVYNVLNDTKYYFMSRPRRFGKSLFLDTIAEAFSGDKELFKGLWIYDSGYNFEKHPVLRLDMSNIANDGPEILKEELSIELKKRVQMEGFDIDYNTPSAIFKTFYFWGYLSKTAMLRTCGNDNGNNKGDQTRLLKQQLKTSSRVIRQK